MRKSFLVIVVFLSLMPFAAFGQDAMTVYENGSVVIGTPPASAPAEKLTVVGNVSITGTCNVTPVGSILLFAGSSAPAGWLLCQGQAISRTTYATLFAVIGTTFGAGDGSTTFNLPDFRESSPVGAGQYSAVTGTTHGAISASNSYALGQFKDDQVQEHVHSSFSGDGQNWNDNAPGSGYYYMANGAWRNGSGVTNARVGTTTHGKQLGINFMIRATY